MTNTLTRALEAYEQTNFDEAGQICDELLRAEPENAAVLMLAGIIARKTMRFEEAIPLLEKSVRNDPTAEARANLAQCLWRTGRLDDALTHIDGALADDADNAEALLLKAAILHGLRRFDAALDCVDHAQEVLPDSHLVAARRACILTELGDYDAAESCFREATRLAPEAGHYGLINFRQGVWREIAAPGPPAATQEIELLRSIGGERPYDAVVAAVCDARYFYKYGATFVNSFMQNAGPDPLLHLHIVDPDARFPGHIDGVLAHFPHRNIVVSCEQSPIEESRYKARRTYYSCVRFLRIGWLLQHYQKTIACFDVDTVFEAPLAGMLESVREADVGLVPREPIDSPWLDVVANLVIANNTESAQRYFAAVEKFIRHFIAHDKMFWHLDQIALYCVLRMMQRFAQPPRVRWLADAARAAVWHIGKPYAFRLEDPRVARYRLD